MNFERVATEGRTLSEVARDVNLGLDARPSTRGLLDGGIGPVLNGAEKWPEKYKWEEQVKTIKEVLDAEGLDFDTPAGEKRALEVLFDKDELAVLFGMSPESVAEELQRVRK